MGNYGIIKNYIIIWIVFNFNDRLMIKSLIFNW